MRIVVTCMKNEGPFMLEWIAFHLSIGFDRFLIYTNDCDDGTDKITDRLAELGFCQRLDNPRVGNQRPQAVAMRDMFKREIVKSAEWVFFSDCDEFLNIHLGVGHLDDLLAAAGDAEVISPMWRLFGDAGIVDFKDAPVIEQFLLAAPASRPVSVNSWGFKSLFRPTPNVARIGAHRPFFKDEGAVVGRWLRSDGKQMDQAMITQGWRYTRGNGGYDWAQLNHYAVRSVDSFLVKCSRGHVLHTHLAIDVEYHNMFNHNDEGDLSILRRLPEFQKILDVLKADKVLAALHDEACQLHQHQAKVLRVQQSATYEALCNKASTLNARAGPTGGKHPVSSGAEQK